MKVIFCSTGGFLVGIMSLVIFARIISYDFFCYQDVAQSRDDAKVLYGSK